MSPAQPISTEVAEMLEAGPVCRVWAEQDEGPYHRDDQPVRRDIVEGRPGLPLQLGMRLERDGGVRFGGVAAEIWHCDALGRDTTNDTDTIFPTGGVPAVLDIAPARDGYRAAACLVIGSPGLR